MDKKIALNILLSVLSEEAKKIKKKKKSLVSTPMMRRPLGSTFALDLTISESHESEFSELRKQVINSKDIGEFLKNIITDFDVRYKNRKAAQPLVKEISIDFVDEIKPIQKTEVDTVNDWKEIIEKGGKPFIIIRMNKMIDGHHKLEAYKQLGFKMVPVLFEADLIEFYGKNKANSLNEGYGQKPVPKKFDHLKWQLTQSQKHFLDDFINVPEESLRKEDYEYASKQTSIPIENIKSIKNTLSDKKTPEATLEEMEKIHRDLVGGTLAAVNQQFTDVRDLPKDKSGRFYPINNEPNFRGMSPKEVVYNKTMMDELDMGVEKASEYSKGPLTRKWERELPGFMYEWLLYFIEGSDKFKITESKLMNDFYSDKFDKCKFVFFSFDVSLKESKSHAYDLASTNARMKEMEEFTKKLNEFNQTFGTNFIVGNQFTGKDGFLKVVIENAQLTDGKKTYNRKFINMDDNDIQKALSLGFYDQFTTTRSITG